MRVAAAAALSIVLGATAARAQEAPGTPPDPNHRTSEPRAAEAGKSDDLGRVWYVDARDSLRAPIPSL